MSILQRFANLVKNSSVTKYFVTLFFIVLIVGFLDDNSIMNRQDRIREIEKLQQEIDVLKQQYEADTRKLHSLEDYDNVVRIAREKYLMKRPGEDLFIVTAPQIQD